MASVPRENHEGIHQTVPSALRICEVREVPTSITRMSQMILEQHTLRFLLFNALSLRRTGRSCFDADVQSAGGFGTQS